MGESLKEHQVYNLVLHVTLSGHIALLLSFLINLYESLFVELFIDVDYFIEV